MDSLWGEEFAVEEKKKTEKILNKIKKPKTEKSSAEKQISSKTVSVETKLALVKDKVYEILGKQIDNVLVIRKKEDLHTYLEAAIHFGRLAVDTETNNSLDPITCKLMGLCLYVKGQKQCYVPVNHIDKDTDKLLPNQLTEQDIAQEFEYFLANRNNCKVIFHNGKFDYQVIKHTCGIKLPIDWDTMIGAKLLDENEKSAGLKQQYISKIDPEQEKYSIENLFEKLPYAVVEPELFALYAATDAMMTDRLYEYQMDQFKNPDLAKVLKLALDVEMPLIEIVAEMEDYGVEFDNDYDKVLSNKYHTKLDIIDRKLETELANIKDKIAAWRLTPEATFKPKNKKGDGEGKSKSEQLTDPINLASPTQLAILFYDILKCPQVNKKHPRGTGEEELLALANKMKLPLFKLLLERRGVVKLLDAFIDSLPLAVNVDGRIHCKFNQYGAATGRFSSSEPNLQQIPSHNSEIRMIFKASSPKVLIEENAEGIFKVSSLSDVLTEQGWKPVKTLTCNDLILLEDNSSVKVKSIIPSGDSYLIKYL